MCEIRLLIDVALIDYRRFNFPFEVSMNDTCDSDIVLYVCATEIRAKMQLSFDFARSDMTQSE